MWKNLIRKDYSCIILLLRRVLGQSHNQGIDIIRLEMFLFFVLEILV